MEISTFQIVNQPIYLDPSGGRTDPDPKPKKKRKKKAKASTLGGDILRDVPSVYCWPNAAGEFDDVDDYDEDDEDDFNDEDYWDRGPVHFSGDDDEEDDDEDFDEDWGKDY